MNDNDHSDRQDFLPGDCADLGCAAPPVELEAILSRIERRSELPEDRRRLNALLVADAGCRAAYAGWMRLSAELAWHFSPATPLSADEFVRFTLAESFLTDDAVLEAIIEPEPSAAGAVSSSPLMGEGRLASPSPLMGEGRGEGFSGADRTRSADGTRSVPATLTKSPVLGFLGGVVDYVSNSRTLLFWLICGTLGLYFAVQLGSLVVGRFWAQNAALVAEDRGREEGKDGPTDGSLRAAGGVAVARLSNAVDCQWQFGSSLKPGTEFGAGQKLNLTSGLAELTFASGAKVILHAPSRFSVTDALGGDLQGGKLTAKVPHTAAGFTIATPSGKVVDLGTEFGVKVNDDRTTHVIVYVGEVKVESSSSGAGAATRSSPVRVKAGEAVVVAAGQPVKTIPPADERFIRDLDPLIARQQSEAAYVEFMKKLKPAVWFRMEGKETERVLHDEMGGPDAKLVWDGPGNPFVKGTIGKGLWLRGPQLKEYAFVPDYPKAEHGKLSVAAWAYADSRPNWPNIASNWTGQFHFALCSEGKTESIDLCARVKQANGRDLLVREGQAHPFPLNEWQHVAFTSDGATLRLYRQGREVAQVKQAGLRFPAPERSLTIGGAFPTTNPSCYWSGKLDEVAVFNDTLSADDIRKLAGAAPR